uniref:Uncharacterized protein n=1 Tax=Musa balbisiana TaxID=52838 RepID=L8BSP5_MUSBA|nr:Hypothetical protein BN340_96 [Musa balbisiana]
MAGLRERRFVEQVVSMYVRITKEPDFRRSWQVTA